MHPNITNKTFIDWVDLDQYIDMRKSIDLVIVADMFKLISTKTCQWVSIEKVENKWDKDIHRTSHYAQASLKVEDTQSRL